VAAKFVVKKTKGGQMMFNLVAPNGEIVLTSEQYKSMGGLKNGIKSVKTHAKDEKNFKKLDSKKGEPYFVLRAGNNRVIGRSEMYSSENALKNGIDSVKKNAPTAVVENVTK
jgi:hypothetical protein